MDEQERQREDLRVEDTSVIFKGIFWDQARSVREVGRCNLGSEIVREWAESTWQLNTKRTMTVNSSLAVELTALNLCAATIGALASCVLNREHSERPLPVNWGGRQNGEASAALWCLLAQYVNRSLSMVSLCQHGFESSAKIIVRTLLEMARILVVIAVDSGYMQSYLNASRNPQCKSEWQGKAGTDEVLKRLREIECQIGLSAQWADYMHDKREVAYSHLCQAAHSNYQEMVVCSFLPSHADDDQPKSTMFGAPSPGLKPSLEEAISTTCCLLVELKTVFENVHGFSATDRDENWNNFKYIYNTMILIWLSHFAEGSTGDESREYLKSLGIDSNQSAS